MQVYVAVAEAESFVKAARVLNMSPPAVTRAVAILEESLGVKLLNRTTRYVRVTDAGQRYFEDAKRILMEVDEIDELAAGINTTPRGHLVVTAPVIFGRMFVTPMIVRYLQQFSAVTVSAVFLDRIVNLLEEGIDVGVRIGQLPDSSMRAIKVGYVQRVLCASPDYLAQHGVPTNPEALAHHTLIAASSISPSNEWQFQLLQRKIVVKVQPRLVLTNNDDAIEAAVKGFGITRLLSYQVASQVAAGRLQVILSDYDVTRMPIHIVHRENRYASGKIRSFVDLLADSLRSQQVLYLTGSL